jgi:hypothetical protein
MIGSAVSDSSLARIGIARGLPRRAATQGLTTGLDVYGFRPDENPVAVKP